jgi:predicted transcriptional regulator
MVKAKSTEGELIKKRIDSLGLMSKHVAKRCKMHPTTLAKIIAGVSNNPKSIAKINAYLDSVKS